MEIKNQEKRNNSKFSVWVLFFCVFFTGWLFVSGVSFGEMNIFEDKDQDGLSDQEERAYGTDPNNPDTDGDGYSDGTEVKSGYDPLKPAPGDKIKTESQVLGTEDEQDFLLKQSESENFNYTEEFLNKLKNEKGEELSAITDILNNPESLEDESVLENLGNTSLTTEDLNEIINGIAQQKNVTEEIEIIPRNSINILEKPEGSEEEVKEKEKQQIQEYLSVLSYIAFSNAPLETLSENQLSQSGLLFISQLSTYLEAGNSKELELLRSKAEKAYQELNQVDVPEVLVDIHLLGMSLLKYSLENIDEKALIDSRDPVEMLITLNKFQAVLAQGENLKKEIQSILDEYEIEFLNFNSSGAIEKEEDEDTPSK